MNRLWEHNSGVKSQALLLAPGTPCSAFLSCFTDDWLWSPPLEIPDTHSGWPNAICLLLLNCITVAPWTVTQRLLSLVLTVSWDFSSTKTRPRSPQLLLHRSGTNKLTNSTWGSRWGRQQRSVILNCLQNSYYMSEIWNKHKYSVISV